MTTKTLGASYKVVTQGAPLEVWAVGFWDRAKAERMIAEGYFHRHMYERDKGKTLCVVPESR